MCGIFWSEKSAGHEETAELIKSRGPTSFAERKYEGVFLMSSVLGIRGHATQPVVGDCYALQYNGELYNGRESDTEHIQGVVERLVGSRVPAGVQSMSGYFAHPQEEAGAPAPGSGGGDAPGESDFAFVLEMYAEINRDENELAVSVIRAGKAYFFKDDVGRRSLGISRNPFTLSSAGYEEELDPLRLYVYSFRERRLFSVFKPAEGLVKLYLERVCTIGSLIFSARHPRDHRHLVGYGPLAGATCATCHRFDQGPAEDDFVSRFGRSVRLRMPAEDPVLFFSGGVDSTLVALFLHLQTPPDRPIYLVNTAFPGSFDRSAGAASHRSLRNAFSRRDFVLVENDLEVGLIRRHRPRIHALMRPKTGLMDFNIAAVLYFSSLAARSLGRVVFTGSGADEVFGGYGRYKDAPTRFRDRMFFDLFTVSSHNISRDDRIISGCGLEARLPFLDTSLIAMALRLPDSCFIRPGSEVENKCLLRSVLRAFGLDQAAAVPKKAMQYGAGMKKFEAEINGADPQGHS